MLFTCAKVCAACAALGPNLAATLLVRRCGAAAWGAEGGAVGEQGTADAATPAVLGSAVVGVMFEECRDGVLFQFLRPE